MLTVIRHGSTNFNGDEERFRGWRDLPLSSKGIDDASKVAEKLYKLKLDAEDYYTSPLKRAVQTSEEIGDKLGVDFQVAHNLKDWNIGEFAGKPVDSNLEKINYYLDHKNEKIPEGESYDSFTKRVIPFVKNLVEDNNNHMIITHNRVITLLKALSEKGGKSLSVPILKNKGPIEPGGIITVNPDWETEIVDKGYND